MKQKIVDRRLMARRIHIKGLSLYIFNATSSDENWVLVLCLIPTNEHMGGAIVGSISVERIGVRYGVTGEKSGLKAFLVSGDDVVIGIVADVEGVFGGNAASFEACCEL